MRPEAEEALSGRGKNIWGPADYLGGFVGDQSSQLARDVFESAGNGGGIGGPVSVSIEESYYVSAAEIQDPNSSHLKCNRDRSSLGY